MKNIFKVIIGLIAFLVITPVSSAKFCNPPDRIGSTYENIYCDLTWDERTEKDDDLMDAIAEQLQYDKELVKLFLATGQNEMGCGDVLEFMGDNNLEMENMPPDIQSACENEMSLAPFQNVQSKIQVAYDKERVMYETKTSLEYEFKVAEQYWDGQLRDIGDAPFDLVVDLNLIEIILFGSKATWVSDVFQFPTDDEGGGGSGDDSGGSGGTGDDEDGGTGYDDGDFVDEGVSGSTDETDGTEGDCVPADDPDADIEQNPHCGNGLVDVLYGEQCDDGNNTSGDGCDQYCMTENNGADDICTDPDAITFKTLSSGGGGGSDSSDDSSSEDDCPPGTLPAIDTTIEGPAQDGLSDFPQSPFYPGPNVGGTFKDYPASNKPPCPPGETPITIDESATSLYESTSSLFTDEETNEVTSEEVQIFCMPNTLLCADPNDARDELSKWMDVSGDWKDLPANDKKRIALESIEASFCVELTTHNRPESPYTTNEGCIDCHIAAMVDSIDKALGTNVTPLTNTMNAFSISSRWGPKFSFNLTTTIKSMFKMLKGRDAEDDVNSMDEFVKNAKEESKANKACEDSDLTSAEQIKCTNDAEDKSEEVFKEVIEGNEKSAVVVTDTEFYGRIMPLLDKMHKIFEGIHNQFSALIEATNIHQKTTCQC